VSIGGLIETLVAGLTPPSRRRPVSDDQVTAVLEAARIAPSARNMQTWRFVVVQQAERRTRIAGIVPTPLSGTVAGASAVLVVCGVPAGATRTRPAHPYATIDVAICLSHLLLRATELGLPCAWTLDVAQAPCRQELGIPLDVRIIAVVSLG
jgi:nitroreductase